jgi:hypothetical protein
MEASPLVRKVYSFLLTSGSVSFMLVAVGLLDGSIKNGCAAESRRSLQSGRGRDRAAVVCTQGDGRFHQSVVKADNIEGAWWPPFYDDASVLVHAS